MFCTEKERKTCNVEKMGCEGCYYNNDIKNLEEIIELCKEEIDNDNNNIAATLDFADLKSLRNVINKYKEYEECLEVTSLALNNIAYDQILIAIGDLEAEIEKKDKIINLMAEKLKQLREASLDDCFIPRSYRDIDDCLRTTCEECIKEYFENKVKESK